MPRSLLLPATTTLATLTAVALLAAAMRLPAPGPVALVDAAAANRAVVEGFYDAVNAAIATGDLAPLSAVLAPNYAEPDATGALVPGRAGLERHLRALHAIAPALRLEVDELVGDGERVVAVVRTRGAEGATALGLTLVDPRFWAAVDRFRVADGRVAERAAAGDGLPLLQPLVRAPVELPLPAPVDLPSSPLVEPPSSAPRVVTAMRVTLAPGGWRRVPVVDGLHALVVEDGMLDVTVETGDTLAALPPSYTTALGAGDRLVLPGDGSSAGYEAHNPGSEPAVVLEVLAAASRALRGAATPVAEGVTTRVLAGGQAATVPTGPAALTVGRATLPPGARLAWAPATGPVLLVVEAGTLGLATAGAPTWLRRAAGGPEDSPGMAALAAGDGALVGAATSAEVRNAGDEPLELLVVTLIEMRHGHERLRE